MASSSPQPAMDIVATAQRNATEQMFLALIESSREAMLRSGAHGVIAEQRPGRIASQPV